MKKLLTVASFTALLTFCRMLAGFLVTKVIAVYAGAGGLAALGQIQNLISIFTGIVNAPVGNAVVRYTAQNKENGFECCGVWWRAALQCSFLLFCTLLPFGLFFSDLISIIVFETVHYNWLIKLMFLLLPLSTVSVFITSVINGLQQYKRFIFLGIVSVLVSSILMFLMIIIADVKGALIAAVTQSALISIIMLFSSWTQPWFKIKYFLGMTTKGHRYRIGGYILMAITSAICTPVCLIIIRNILISNVGWSAAGQWQAVWKISEVYLSVITIALSTYYLPRLSTLFDLEIIAIEINKTAIIIFPLITLLALAIYFLRDWIIIILFTPEFGSTRDLFAIQLIGDVIKILSWLYAYPMISHGATKWFLFTEVFFSITLIILSLLFINFYGVIGANLAYLTNYFFYFIFVYFNIKRIINSVITL